MIKLAAGMLSGVKCKQTAGYLSHGWSVCPVKELLHRLVTVSFCEISVCCGASSQVWGRAFGTRSVGDFSAGL